MEMCVDNPREGFADLFATHPSVDSRVDALVNFAGGHDPGPLVLAPPQEQAQEEAKNPPKSRASFHRPHPKGHGVAAKRLMPKPSRSCRTNRRSTSATAAACGVRGVLDDGKCQR